MKQKEIKSIFNQAIKEIKDFYMFMYKDKEYIYFKHKLTREYIKIYVSKQPLATCNLYEYHATRSCNIYIYILSSNAQASFKAQANAQAKAQAKKFH